MMPTIVLKSDCQAKLNSAFAEQTPTEICVTFHKKLQIYCFLDIDIWNMEMKSFRKSHRKGILIINIKNHREFENNGQTKYSFVVQGATNGVFDPEDGFNSPCRIGMAYHNFVNGQSYVFNSKQNRDAIYEYITKKKD